MEIVNEYSKHITAIEILMRSKGYTGHFQLTSKEGRSDHCGLLKNCLQEYLKDLQQRNITQDKFYLTTYAEYLSDENYKQCFFVVSFDLTNGIKFHDLNITSNFPNEKQKRLLRNNEEIPGRNAVIGLFRKPKPWDRMIRGDFKYRKGL